MGYIEINAFGVVLRPSYLITNHVEQRNFLNMFKYVFSSRTTMDNIQNFGREIINYIMHSPLLSGIGGLLLVVAFMYLLFDSYFD